MDTATSVTVYAALFADAILGQLPAVVTATRHTRALSLRAAAAQIGCSAATLHNLERETKSPSLGLVRHVLQWVAQPPPPPGPAPDLQQPLFERALFITDEQLDIALDASTADTIARYGPTLDALADS